MRELNRYKKKNHIEIQTKYFSLLLVASVVLVGLVFALGVLVGGERRAPLEECAPPDPLAALDLQSGEPAPPEIKELKLRSFHETLSVAASAVPTPASLPPEALPAPLAPGVADQNASALAQPLEHPRHEEQPVPEKVTDAEPGHYSLQVASFQDQREATEMVRKLKHAGHRSFLVAVDMPDRGGRWFRVRVGPFKSKRDAWRYKEQFEQNERLPTFVVKRRSSSRSG